jgi:hypothetical protein
MAATLAEEVKRRKVAEALNGTSDQEDPCGKMMGEF